MKYAKQFWHRIGLIASGVWFGLVIIWSEVTLHDFRWFPYMYRNDYTFGPAATTAFVGVGIIWIVCLGIPWIGETKQK